MPWLVPTVRYVGKNRFETVCKNNTALWEVSYRYDIGRLVMTRVSGKPMPEYYRSLSAQVEELAINYIHPLVEIKFTKEYLCADHIDVRELFLET